MRAMKKIVIVTMILVLIISNFMCVSGNVSVTVGIKERDWIEYEVNISGSAASDHDINWARLEVTKIEGAQLTLNVQTKFSNGTLTHDELTLDLEAGVLGDDFVIPANLTVGDTFLDSRQGKITISSTEQRAVAGVERTIISGYSSETKYYWDSATGFLVEATSIFPQYSMITRASKTNMWFAETTGLNSVVLFTLIGAATIIFAILMVTLILRRKYKT
jgi:hypothetical protein